MIILAAAMGLNGELGQESGVPLWNLPDEYQRFRESIFGHPIIIGRKSFDVLSKPLEGSLNIVITRNENYDGRGAVVVRTLGEALSHVDTNKKVYIIGGGIIFETAMSVADKMEISIIDATFPTATAFFPKFSKEGWQLCSDEKHWPDDRHVYSFRYQTWMRIN